MTFFTRSALLNAAITSSRPRSISSLTVGWAARSAIESNSMPSARAHAGATSGSRTTRADTKGRWSPMAHAWPTRGIILRLASRLAGLMFLPPAVMISSFLRSTMRT